MALVYFHDSVAMLVYAFDFDLETGNISNKRILIDRRTSFGEPDGMVVEYALSSSFNGKKRLTRTAQTATSGSPCSIPIG